MDSWARRLTCRLPGAAWASSFRPNPGSRQEEPTFFFRVPFRGLMFTATIFPRGFILSLFSEEEAMANWNLESVPLESES
jgi:hypothetical protein